MAEPKIIEIHHRRDVVAVAVGAAGSSEHDRSGRQTWFVGPLVPVELEPEALGSLLVELIAAEPTAREAVSSAAANGDWCRTFGLDELSEVVDGLRTVLLVVGGRRSVVEYIAIDGRPVTERDLEPDDLTDAHRLGLVVLGVLERAPRQRRFDHDR